MSKIPHGLAKVVKKHRMNLTSYDQMLLDSYEEHKDQSKVHQTHRSPATKSDLDIIMRRSRETVNSIPENEFKEMYQKFDNMSDMAEELNVLYHNVSDRKNRERLPSKSSSKQSLGKNIIRNGIVYKPVAKVSN